MRSPLVLILLGFLLTYTFNEHFTASAFANEGLEERLIEAGDNREQLQQALSNIPAAQKPGLQFLIENMPTRDLRSLSAEYLQEHVALAYEARESAKWGTDIPEDIFLNELLPYANVNEARDNVRRQLRDKFWPQVKDLDSISLAAAKLNQAVFQQLKVKYSTARRRADQGPAETMESGIASCTGLSILYIDACRACGIPARFVGTPLWSDGSGNHSWVEIWDDGWHFTGAAEPTGDELDKGWFVGRAKKATSGKHGIYAVSFKRTDTPFPMVWTRGKNEVSAIDVTSRYQAGESKQPQGKLAVRFRALSKSSQETVRPQRCQANLLLRDKDGKVVFRGQTNDESSDANDHVTAQLEVGEYELKLIGPSGEVLTKTVQVSKDEQLISLELPADKPEPADFMDWLDGALSQIESLKDLSELQTSAQADDALSSVQAEAATKLVVAKFKQLMLKERKLEHEAKVIEIGDHRLRYDVRVFGEAPDEGHCLVISMHGGGGAPKALNDRQWENQKRLYSFDQAIYVSPRAPTDTWNLWHQGHIDPLFTRLISNMIVFDGVNPNRVYITGYSAGGDGVFQLAPRMADQLAAAAMMAGHPNETKPDGLRNLPFTLHMGEKDGAYSRNQKAAEWKSALAKLQAEDAEGYEHWVKIHAGKGHWMDRQDKEGVDWMLQFTRDLEPQKVVWLQDDVVHPRFYWLAVDDPAARKKLVVSRAGNALQVEQADVEKFSVLLRDSMVNLEEPITVSREDAVILQVLPERKLSTILQTLLDRGDPSAVFSAKVDVELPKVK